jgi:hypothetical protein
MMRLGVLERGHTFAQKALFRIIRLASGFEAPDVVKTLWYRKAFFGEPQSALTQLVMRGESTWTVAEREIFAAWVSRLNQCVF